MSRSSISEPDRFKVAADDDTIILRPRRPSRRLPLLAAGLLGVAVGGGLAGWIGWRMVGPPPQMVRAAAPAIPVAAPPATPPATPPTIPAAPAVEPIPPATEVAIAAQSPAAVTALRFAANPAIVVLDFPTLAEQGRMLNRLAAWAEKAGMPHDRLLDDAALALAIQDSGATPDTFYYGHDYRGSDIVRFFDLADQEGILLRPEERDLRRLAARASQEEGGFGALISLVRASRETRITPTARAVILDHELSHGEYFTSPAYAAFVQSVWRSMLTAEERAAFRRYLAAEGYDAALEDVMRNEMQAYLMFTADRAFFDPDRLGLPAPRLRQLRTQFLAGMPPGWLRDRAEVLLPELPVPHAAPAKPHP